MEIGGAVFFVLSESEHGNINFQCLQSFLRGRNRGTPIPRLPDPGRSFPSVLSAISSRDNFDHGFVIVRSPVPDAVFAVVLRSGTPSTYWTMAETLLVPWRLGCRKLQWHGAFDLQELAQFNHCAEVRSYFNSSLDQLFHFCFRVFPTMFHKLHFCPLFGNRYFVFQFFFQHRNIDIGMMISWAQGCYSPGRTAPENQQHLFRASR